MTLLITLLLILQAFQIGSSLTCGGTCKDDRGMVNNYNRPQKVEIEYLPIRKIIAVQWKFEDDTSLGKLKVSISNVNTSQTFPKQVNYAQEGKVTFQSPQFEPGTYIAMVHFLACPKMCRVSAEFKWPPSPASPRDALNSSRPTCPVPEVVTVSVRPGYGVTVSWSWYMVRGGIIVGIILNDGENINYKAFTEETTIFKEQKNETTFPDFNPERGSYRAVVGSVSCEGEPMIYEKSEPFYWQGNTDAENTSVTVKHGVAKMEGKRLLPDTKVYIIIISVVASFGILVFGILVYISCSKSKETYDQEHGLLIPPEMTFDMTLHKLKKKICGVHTITVLYPPEQEDLFNIATRVIRKVQGQGRTVTLMEFAPDLDIDEVDVILYVTNEGEKELPGLLKTYINKVVVVAMSENGQYTPSVYFPGNFVYDDVIDDVLSLDDFVQLFGDDKLHILLVCNGDNENQRRKSKKLYECLEETNVDVVYPDDRKHREKQRENLDQWVTERLEESHYIVVVTGDDEHLNPCPSNLTRCAMTALDLLQTLDQDDVRRKVLLVTFGQSLDQTVITKRPFLSVCNHFSLNEDEDYPQLMCRPLLEYIGIEKNICFQDGEVFRESYV